VVRDHATLVVGDIDAETEAVVQRVTGERHARLVRAPVDPGVEVAAPGRFQRRNFALAAAAAQAFLGRGLDRSALEAAGAEIRIPGRLEVVGEHPVTVYDGAHNPSGAVALADALPEVMGERRPRVIVMAVLEDKDAAGMLRALLPAFDHAVYTRCENPRSLSPATLETLGAKLGGSSSETVANPHLAVERARSVAGPGGAVLATGSIYLIADLVRERGQSRASTL
jgi:dihydrofolate synthase/folylpolyglutamate synthase